jgi:hypothetical protein
MRAGGKSNNSMINIFKQNIENIKILRNENFFNLIKFIYFKLLHRFKQLLK